MTNLPENPYLLLTPGPLSTTQSVKAAMLQDWCTWDDDYNRIVQEIREQLVKLASSDPSAYTAVLMQGSGTYCVESVLQTAVPRNGKLLVLANGAYGDRIALIARRVGIPQLVQDSGETGPPDPVLLEQMLADDPSITHVAVVHCETTTGMCNPVAEIGKIVKSFRRIFIVDAMSSFGGIPMEMEEIGADYLVSSANKCIQGVPGFGFIIARKAELARTEGNARSLSMDAYDQWRVMEEKKGKWRFTSPTHTVRAFAQALKELESEGGVKHRHERYQKNHRILVSGMRELGFETLLPDHHQSPIITAFYSPAASAYRFERFYAALKEQCFVIYPGKVTSAETFRIGNIGNVFPVDMRRLLQAVEKSIYWKPD